jgi:hypothetical protein
MGFPALPEQQQPSAESKPQPEVPAEVAGEPNSRPQDPLGTEVTAAASVDRSGTSELIYSRTPVRTITDDDRAILDDLLSWTQKLRPDSNPDSIAAAVITCLDKGRSAALTAAAARLCWTASDTRRPGRLSAPMPWWAEAQRRVGAREDALEIHASQQARSRAEAWRSLAPWGVRTEEESHRARAGAALARQALQNHLSFKPNRKGRS